MYRYTSIIKILPKLRQRPSINLNYRRLFFYHSSPLWYKNILYDDYKNMFVCRMKNWYFRPLLDRFNLKISWLPLGLTYIRLTLNLVALSLRFSLFPHCSFIKFLGVRSEFEYKISRSSLEVRLSNFSKFVCFSRQFLDS